MPYLRSIFGRILGLILGACISVFDERGQPENPAGREQSTKIV